MRWITVFLLIKFLWKFSNGLVLECKCWLLEVLSRLVLTPSKPRYWSLGYLSFIFFSSILLLYHFGFVLHHCVFKPKHNVSPIWQLMKKACFHSSTRMLFLFLFLLLLFLSFFNTANLLPTFFPPCVLVCHIFWVWAYYGNKNSNFISMCLLILIFTYNVPI